MPDGLAALYCDEDVSLVAAAMLRARGFSLTTARDAGRLGRSDGEQLRFASEIGSVHWLGSGRRTRVSSSPVAASPLT